MKRGRKQLKPEQHTRHCRRCGVLIVPEINGWLYKSGKSKGRPCNICKTCANDEMFEKLWRKKPLAEIDTKISRLHEMIDILGKIKQEKEE